MLMRTDPFRELDRLAAAAFGTPARPASAPMDAYREGESFVIHVDLPGITPDSLDVEVERNVLTLRAERTGAEPEGAELVVAERPRGTFSRQVILGDTLDTERLEATYDAGVLTLRVPVAERAKARKVSVAGGGGEQKVIEGESAAA